MTFFAFTFIVPFTLRFLLPGYLKILWRGTKYCQNRFFIKKTKKKNRPFLRLVSESQERGQTRVDVFLGWRRE